MPPAHKIYNIDPGGIVLTSSNDIFHGQVFIDPKGNNVVVRSQHKWLSVPYTNVKYDNCKDSVLLTRIQSIFRIVQKLNIFDAHDQEKD